MSSTTTCPECGRPSAGAAFATTATYVRCSWGHVFPADVDPDVTEAAWAESVGGRVVGESL